MIVYIIMRTILIVEDERYIFDGLKFVFNKHGFNTLVAKNGKEALEILKNNNVDIIMTDLCMPEMDGYDTAIEVRKLDKYKDIPIIAYTGFVNEIYYKRADESGINEVINKPLNPEKVLEVLKKYMSA